MNLREYQFLHLKKALYYKSRHANILIDISMVKILIINRAMNSFLN